MLQKAGHAMGFVVDSRFSFGSTWDEGYSDKRSGSHIRSTDNLPLGFILCLCIFSLLISIDCSSILVTALYSWNILQHVQVLFLSFFNFIFLHC